MFALIRWKQLGSVFFSALFGAIFFMTPVLAADKVETNLEKAIKSGKKQILFSGKEKDDITIKAGVAVTGVSIDKATIAGDIKMENGSSLTNVTVSGKRTVITIAKGASVTLSNVTVRGGQEMGIYALGGGGTLTVRGSRITNNRKGFYILPGKNLNLVGNVVMNNKEEGLDVRAAPSGNISGNQFINNGEGGAEIIAGGARLTIANNTFSGNKSSGLAIQSYSGDGKAPGSIILKNNSLVNNKQYGLTCGSPSAGGAGIAFYRSTIKATDNVLRGNGSGAIHPECGVVNRSTVIAEEKEKETLSEKEESPRIDEAKLREEARIHFEETIALLHDEEYLLEITLTAYDEETEWWERLTRPVINGEAKEAVIKQIAHINELRDTVASFPREFSDEALDTKRQETVLRSLERMEELRQYFERLQTPLFRLRSATS